LPPGIFGSLITNFSFC